MFKKLMERFLPKSPWQEFCKEFRKDGLLEVSEESVLAAISFFENPEIKAVSRLHYREIYIQPTIGSLYNLLLFLRDCNNSLDSGAGLATLKVEDIGSIRLDQWMEFPSGAEWERVDLLSAVRIMGGLLKRIIEKKGGIPETYFNRKMNKAMECYLILAEILGDINDGKS